MDLNKTTILKKCTCYSPFQDKEYGVQMRVHRITKGESACTVCVPAKWYRTFAQKWKLNFVPAHAMGGNPSLGKFSKDLDK